MWQTASKEINISIFLKGLLCDFHGFFCFLKKEWEFIHARIHARMRVAYCPAIGNIYTCMYLAWSFLRLLRARPEALSSPRTSTHHNLGLLRPSEGQTSSALLLNVTLSHTMAFCTLFGVWSAVEAGQSTSQPHGYRGMLHSHRHTSSFAKADFGVEATKNQINKSHLGKGEKNTPPPYTTRERDLGQARLNVSLIREC